MSFAKISAGSVQPKYIDSSELTFPTSSQPISDAHRKSLISEIGVDALLSPLHTLWDMSEVELAFFPVADLLCKPKPLSLHLASDIGQSAATIILQRFPVL